MTPFILFLKTINKSNCTMPLMSFSEDQWGELNFVKSRLCCGPRVLAQKDVFNPKEIVF